MRKMTIGIAALLLSGCGAALAAQPFAVTTVATLDNPWAMAFLPDGRALITEKTGQLRILSRSGKLGAPIAGVPKVVYAGQGGLLDVAISPYFATDSLVYLSFTEAGSGGKGLTVVRAKLANDRLGPLTVIWRQDPKVSGNGHFGSRMVLTKNDELFITAGERQKFTPAQATGQTLGKIVRLTLTGAPKPDNPFVGNKAYKPEVWTLGHRNPLGLALDPATGNLWEHEMGPQGGDEVNLIVRGRNYGWPNASNGSHYDGRDIPDHTARDGFEPPKKSWNPSVSPAGMIVYTGDLFPAWKGHILMGALSGEALIDLTIAGTSVTQEVRHAMDARIREVEQGPDGSVYLLTDGDDGKLLRLTPN